MKRPITPAYTFTPGSSTLNLSGIGSFNVAKLFAVIHIKSGAVIYAPLPGYGYSALSGTTLTLQAPMTGLNGSDPLMILYDDSNGSAGLDFSLNRPNLPVVGSDFTVDDDNPYSTWTLVGTRAANLARFRIDVFNNSGDQIIVVRDDGSAASGAAPNNATIMHLPGGAPVGSLSSAWGSDTFKGRVQIYAPASTAFVSICED